MLKYCKTINFIIGYCKIQGSQGQKIIENHLGGQVATKFEANLACRSAKGHLGSVVGRRERPEGVILAILGAFLECSWGLLERSWGLLEASWEALGSILESSYRSLGVILELGKRF